MNIILRSWDRPATEVASSMGFRHYIPGPQVTITLTCDPEGFARLMEWCEPGTNQLDIPAKAQPGHIVRYREDQAQPTDQEP